MMLEDLENALAEHAPAGGELASELPPLTIDGIPVSVDKMTQVSPSAARPGASGVPEKQCPAGGTIVKQLSQSVRERGELCVKVTHVFSGIISV